MLKIQGREVDYAWGSHRVIQEMLGREPDGKPLAELWFGAHPAAPAWIDEGAGQHLRDHILDDPDRILGDHVLARFGTYLPFLLKVIAPDKPLSLQVHPNLDQARAGFEREESQGVARSAATRLYPDPNHKPELIYALTPFRSLSGFRTPRRAIELVSGLGVPLAKRLEEILRATPTAHGVRLAITELLTPGRVSAKDVDDVVLACAKRQGARGGSVRIDRIVTELGKAYPGDPGVVTALLLNPVTLQPGEAMFVPAQMPHAYLSGLGVEIMANSDNVLRAGLTSKHVDAGELLAVVDCVAAPPVRIAPEVVEATRVFYAPVEDFELSITGVPSQGATITGSGPRIVLCVSGESLVDVTGSPTQSLTPGEAVFIGAGEDSAHVHGTGIVVQAAVP